MKPTWGNAGLERWPGPRPCVTRMTSHLVLGSPGGLAASPALAGAVHRLWSTCPVQHTVLDALGDVGVHWCMIVVLDKVSKEAIRETAPQCVVSIG